MKKLLFCIFLIAMAMTVVPAMATPFPTLCGTYPAVVEYGNSYCINACQNDVFVTFLVEGQFSGQDAFPLFVFTPGCANCSDDRSICVPIADVPTHFEQVQSPIHPDRWDYNWFSNCILMTASWVHTNTWEVSYFINCGGCFCLTFDRQESVELSSFTAEAGASAINLHWSTASETQSAQWLINRSESESGTFSFLGQLPAAGTTTQGQTYSWTDHNVTAGHTYYYRLSEQDMNGAVSPVGGIVQAELTSTVGSLPGDYALEQNYPNPFNPSTEISYTMKDAGLVTIKVYNMLGQEVAVLVNNEVTAGKHVIQFNASNLPSALYLCKMEANGFSATNKMLLMK